MSLLHSLFDQALAPRPEPRLEPQPPNCLGPANAAPANQTNDELVRSGLTFLLMPKDRYGVWYWWANVNSASPQANPSTTFEKEFAYVRHRPTRQNSS